MEREMDEMMYDYNEYENIRYEIDRIKKIEDSVKAKPTIKDLKETIRLLEDFGIEMKIEEIPEFRNVAALSRWRVAIINSQI